MTDILGAVNDFIIAYCKNGKELPALKQEQVIVGWQNLSSALSKKTQEVAILTLLNTQRHGTNIHRRRFAEGDTGLVETVMRLAEHMVQVDFCCAHPRYAEERARTRAEILEILTRDRVGVDFFKQFGLSTCYAEDVRPLPFTNEASQQIARYSVTMRLSGWTTVDIDLDSFEHVDLRLENVDVHHNPK